MTDESSDDALLRRSQTAATVFKWSKYRRVSIAARKIPGSARVPAGRDVTSQQTFVERAWNSMKALAWAQSFAKVRAGAILAPARETRALPSTARSPFCGRDAI